MDDRPQASPSGDQARLFGAPLRSQRGQAALEVALLAPFLLFLLLIVAEMGHALNAYITIVDASRDGARIAANGTASDTDIRNLVVNETDRLPGSVDPVNDVTITDGGSSIDVEVCYDHPLLLGLELISSVIPNPLRMCSHTEMAASS